MVKTDFSELIEIMTEDRGVALRDLARITGCAQDSLRRWQKQNPLSARAASRFMKGLGYLLLEDGHVIQYDPHKKPLLEIPPYVVMQFGELC